MSSEDKENNEHESSYKDNNASGKSEHDSLEDMFDFDHVMLIGILFIIIGLPLLQFVATLIIIVILGLVAVILFPYAIKQYKKLKRQYFMTKNQKKGKKRNTKKGFEY